VKKKPFALLFCLLLALMLVEKIFGVGILESISSRLETIAPPPPAVAGPVAAGAGETEKADATPPGSSEEKPRAPAEAGIAVEEGKPYDDAAHVATYLVRFGRLPDNYITKEEARARGWEGGPVGAVAPGCSIGGGHFGNFEGKLPEKRGRKYRECDLDATGKRRGAARLVYSSDGLFFVTRDHYETFEKLELP